MDTAADGVSSVEREAAYYQAVEEHFVSRRGDPLFLSNADWTLVRKWRMRGVPLRVVLRGISDALDSHAHSWSRSRKVASLAYCTGAVEEAAKRWQRALAVGTETGDGGLPDALRRLAEQLQAVSGLSRSVSAVATEVAGVLLSLAVEPPSQDLETKLGRLEARLVKALRRGADPAEIEGIEGGIDSDLEPYRGRMPDRVLAQIRAESVTRHLLQSRCLPRLTLLE